MVAVPLEVCEAVTEIIKSSPNDRWYPCYNHSLNILISKSSKVQSIQNLVDIIKEVIGYYLTPWAAAWSRITLLATKLLCFVVDAYLKSIKIDKPHAWTYSITALTWIQLSSCRWAIFVANKAGQIYEFT